MSDYAWGVGIPRKGIAGRYVIVRAEGHDGEAVWLRLDTETGETYSLANIEDGTGYAWVPVAVNQAPAVVNAPFTQEEASQAASILRSIRANNALGISHVHVPTDVLADYGFVEGNSATLQPALERYAKEHHTKEQAQ